MKIKNLKISLILVLSLGMMPLMTDIASANNLTRLDIKKNTSSASAVDVTLYTTTPYNDSVAVTKKSDNKYVILMPNVSGSAGKAPDLSGLKDIISNVDIKSVNDGAGSYTKVTLTTTKPISIKTHTQKSLPVTEGQKAYRELLAQSEIREAAPVPVKPALKDVQKPIVSVNKTETTVKEQAKPEAVKPAVEKKNNIVAKAKAAVKEQTVKNETKAVEKSSTTTTAPKVSTVQKSSDKNVNITESVKDNSVQDVKPEVSNQVEAAPAVTQVKNTPKELSKNNNGRIPSNMPITLAMIFIPLAGLICLFKLIKTSMQNSSMLKKAFIANLKNKKDSVNDYENIINADMNWQEKYQKFVAVSNQNYEKSPKKLASGSVPFEGVPAAAALAAKTETQPSFAAEEPKKEAVNVVPKIKTKKIKKVSQQPNVEINEAVKEMERQISKLEAVKSNAEAKKEVINEKPVDISEAEYAASLERMLHDSPDKEKTDLDDDAILKELEQNFKAVQSEDNVIAAKMSEIPNTPKIKKLKAFANNTILQETHRNRPLPKTAEEVKRAALQEGRHVNLGYSKLHSNPRLLEGANLSAADLIAKSSRFLPDTGFTKQKPVASQPPKQTQKPKVSTPANDDNKGYTMATIEEFFALTDDQSKVTASEELSNRVAGSLANIKPSMKLQQPSSKQMTNPITQLKAESQANYLNGLIVKSGFNIDKDRGFYLVNLDGEMALIGRIKEEVFVLKKFNRPIEKPLQVRKDNPNVYMVKTDGFRSLVEVSENNMGVLIEL